MDPSVPSTITFSSFADIVNLLPKKAICLLISRSFDRESHTFFTKKNEQTVATFEDSWLFAFGKQATVRSFYEKRLKTANEYAESCYQKVSSQIAQMWVSSLWTVRCYIPTTQLVRLNKFLCSEDVGIEWLSLIIKADFPLSTKPVRTVKILRSFGIYLSKHYSEIKIDISGVQFEIHRDELGFYIPANNA